MKSFLLGALLVAVIALAYFYWEERNTVSIGGGDSGLPTVEIETK